MVTVEYLPRLLDHRREDVPLPDAPRVMVVAPGPLFSTFDVWEGAVAGMRACGALVHAHDYHHDLRLVGAIEEAFVDDDHVSIGSATLYASHRAVALAMAFRPDLLLFISGTVFPPPTAAMLGQWCRTAVWLTESPYQDTQELVVQNYYRSAYTNERRMVERIRAQRIADGHRYPDEVYYLPHAYDPDRHFPREAEDAYASDVLFIGSPFPERQALLRGVNWEGIHFVAHGVFGDPLQQDPQAPALSAPSGNVSNAEAQRWYASAKININHHRVIRWYGREQTIEAGEADSLNPRVYELAAGRCFQICDDSRPELTELFGDSIPTYRHDDSADLERVIRYYLAHPDERARCAERAFARVRDHAVTNRMRYVLETALAP
jgi:spore maturation protein CgeB